MAADAYTWMLGIPPGERPPSPHQLLDVSPDEADCRILEEKVMQRLEQVRKYQIRYPEESSQLQNDIAGAFLILCDAPGPRPKQGPAAKPATTQPDRGAATAPTILSFHKAVVSCPPAEGPGGTARKKASRRNPVLVELRLAGVGTDEMGTARPDSLAWHLQLQAVRLTPQERTRLASRVTGEPAARQACVVAMQQTMDAGLGEQEIVEVLRACLDALSRSCA
jgi:hypothetical protein